MKSFSLFLIVLCFSLDANAYPIDSYKTTGIRRLEHQRLIEADSLPGKKQPKGALLADSSISLKLKNYNDSDLFIADPQLQKKVNQLFSNLDKNYSLSILVMKPGQKPRYASHRDQVRYQPGSVGKIAVLTGVMDEMARRYPKDTLARRDFMKNRIIPAQGWINVDTKTAPFYDVKTKKAEKRKFKIGDKLSLYEWMDHMISPSSNASASTVWKEMIMARISDSLYPISLEQEKEFWATTSRSKLIEVAYPLVNGPLYRAGIDSVDFQLGSLFTSYGKKVVPPIGTWATTKALLEYLVRMEQGKVVDEWSSLEIKKMMYTTWKRIRYVTAASLKTSAVYFKSGSLYKCQKEEGYTCEKYKGNVENYMNSIAIIEAPDGTNYWVALMSNVLKKDSAADHRAIADKIHQMIMKW